MGTVYLVRHGQASFGADDYDQLSDLGRRQAVRLGAYWKARSLRFDAIYTGTLRRHAQTLAGIAEGLGVPPAATALPGLDEYDSHALITSVRPGPLARPDTPALRAQHFRDLCDAMIAWQAGRIHPPGMPSWADFQGGVVQALDRLRHAHVGQQVLLVSSGGPIATAITHVMGSPAGVMVGLNMRLRNSAVSELAFSAKRHTLQSFNTLPHLSEAPYLDWVSMT